MLVVCVVVDWWMAVQNLVWCFVVGVLVEGVMLVMGQVDGQWKWELVVVVLWGACLVCLVRLCGP